MATTWQRAVFPRTCGYCGPPPRVIKSGERYLLIQQQSDRQHVRCLECATTRWGLEAPALEDGEDVTSGTPVRTFEERLLDWKQRAAGKD